MMLNRCIITLQGKWEQKQPKSFGTPDLPTPPCDGVKNSDPDISSESLLKGLNLCLDSNYFKYGSKVYKQIGGVGTGVKLAPPYACLAMGEFENEAFRKIGKDEEELLNLIFLWKRFYRRHIFIVQGFRGTV